MLLKERWKDGQRWQEGGEEDVRKCEDTGNWKERHLITLFGELVLKKLWTCHKTDYGMNKYGDETTLSL